MNGLFYRRRALLALVVLLIVMGGVFSYTALPRLEDPELSQRIAFVFTEFPDNDVCGWGILGLSILWHGGILLFFRHLCLRRADVRLGRAVTTPSTGKTRRNQESTAGTLYQ